MTHQAAWIKSKAATLEVGPADTPTPGPSELLVKVKVIAFSPIEWKMQQFEVHPIPYPNNLGMSFAGFVESVGPDVTNFAPGDHIASLRPDDKLEDPRFGAFQQYALASVESTSKLLPGTSLEAGGATILNLSTVVAALSVCLGFDRPPLNGTASRKGQRVLVYGGSSSSGGLAIGYLNAAGYDVVTTSSPRNHEYVASLHPAVIIDHTMPSNKIVESLKANGPYDGILDTIGSPPVTEIVVEYLSGIGGGKYNTLIPLIGVEKPIPENVNREFKSYGWLFNDPQHKGLKEWFYGELLPQGLANGLFVPTRPHWVEGGLEKTQQALDDMKGGISGVKLVLDPWQ